MYMWVLQRFHHCITWSVKANLWQTLIKFQNYMRYRHDETLI